MLFELGQQDALLLGRLASVIGREVDHDQQDPRSFDVAKELVPQALALVVPGIMNSFIAIFKDTSLVTIVSLYELTGALNLALNSDANWRPFKIEGYIFIVLVYFAFCFAMSRYSLWIEKRLGASKNR